MTRYFILAMMLVLLATPRTLAASNPIRETIENAKNPGGQGVPVPPAKHDSPHGPAAKAPQMDELPHIHRFHKQRLVKMTVHHGKLWFFTQVLIILCHLSILVIGYLHATH
jgi:hypothetical protein